jgi:hypothetical protein
VFVSVLGGIEAMRSYIVGWACVVLSCLLNAGCSFLFLSTTPDDHAAMDTVDCTSSRVAPVLDTIGASYQVVRTGFALSADNSDYRDYPISREADIAFGVGFTTLVGASMIYGYMETAECERAKEAASLRRARRGTPPAKPALPPPALACSYDTQCKGDRVCVEGRCVDPPATLPAPPAPPSPAAEPVAPAAPEPTPEPDAAPPPER